MIITKTVKIKTNGVSIKYYRELGYPAKHNKIIEVLVGDLSKGSDTIIQVTCDGCGVVKDIPYRVYINSLKKHNIHVCNKCKHIKHELTCIEKYGTKNVSQVGSVKVKKIKTNLENHGVSNVFQSDNIIKKSKETLFKNYGVEHALQNKELLGKMHDTIYERYGVKHALQNKELFDKAQTNGLQIKTHIESGLIYQGKNELDFINFCVAHKLTIERGTEFQYQYSGDFRTYYPDYYLPDFNLIIEVKSTYIYQKEVKKNEAKKSASIKNGYEFLFVIDKNYDELLTYLS